VALHLLGITLLIQRRRHLRGAAARGIAAEARREPIDVPHSIEHRQDDRSLADRRGKILERRLENPLPWPNGSR